MPTPNSLQTKNDIEEGRVIEKESRRRGGRKIKIGIY